MIYENCNEIKLKRRLIVMRVLEGKLVDKKPIDELPLSLKEKVVLKKLIKAVEGTDHLLSE